EVVGDAETYKLQVVLGVVEEGADGQAKLKQYGFRLGEEYFYPASSVKMFAAVAALEQLDTLRRQTGLPIDADTPLTYFPLFAGEVVESADPSHLEGGTITVRHEIRKLFLVSDNQAFNRLYELVGQDRLARSLRRAGLGKARIVHRLSEARTAEENRRYPKIEARGEGFVYVLPERTSEPLPEAEPIPGLQVGEGYMEGEEKVEAPFDFTAKNRVALRDLQRGLCKIVRPEVDCGGRPFRLTEEDRAILLEALHQLPRESEDPRYDPAEYPDDYVKAFLPGVARIIPPERLQIYNKIGQAYGFETENAWIVDTGTGRGFFLAATLYVNEDGILNDDHYEYEAVAQPFLADLAEAAARHFWAGSAAEASRAR
ncbi:MAG: serine hydrolase, partial [Acidobacteria bacterium]|nr:serine hydrolase [Acidobacteriota bacterium]